MAEPADYELEHAALAVWTIDDPTTRAYWANLLFGKRWPSLLGAAVRPVADETTP